MGKTGSISWVKVKSKKNKKGYRLVKKGYEIYKRPGPLQKYKKGYKVKKIKRKAYSLNI